MGWFTSKQKPSGFVSLMAIKAPPGTLLGWPPMASQHRISMMSGRHKWEFATAVLLVAMSLGQVLIPPEKYGSPLNLKSLQMGFPCLGLDQMKRIKRTCFLKCNEWMQTPFLHIPYCTVSYHVPICAFAYLPSMSLGQLWKSILGDWTSSKCAGKLWLWSNVWHGQAPTPLQEVEDFSLNGWDLHSYHHIRHSLNLETRKYLNYKTGHT